MCQLYSFLVSLMDEDNYCLRKPCVKNLSDFQLLMTRASTTLAKLA